MVKETWATMGGTIWIDARRKGACRLKFEVVWVILQSRNFPGHEIKKGTPSPKKWRSHA